MLLAMDTATHRASVALHDGDTLRGECTWEAHNRHTVTLLPRINELLISSNITADDLTAVAVCIGPGSYTGVRVGVAAAKGFVSGRKIPLIGVTTLDILVASYPQADRPLYATFAAGRKRVGFARYIWREGLWQSDTKVDVLSWAEFAEQISVPSIVIGELEGQGLDVLRKLKDRVILPAPAQSLRRAGFLADIGWQRLRANDVAVPGSLLPIYAR